MTPGISPACGWLWSKPWGSYNGLDAFDSDLGLAEPQHLWLSQAFQDLPSEIDHFAVESMLKLIWRLPCLPSWHLGSFKIFAPNFERHSFKFTITDDAWLPGRVATS